MDYNQSFVLCVISAGLQYSFLIVVCNLILHLKVPFSAILKTAFHNDHKNAQYVKKYFMSF